MNPLIDLMRPAFSLVNKQIQQMTPGRALCKQLEGRVIAMRVKDSSLAVYCSIVDEALVLLDTETDEPDAVISGSLLSLATLAGDGGEQAIRDGRVELTGDAEIAESFQQLLRYGRPDLEEGLSQIIGDSAAHQIGELFRGIGSWGRGARSTWRQNISEYLQEERQDVPTRYEVDRHSGRVSTLRDDVARFEARLKRFESQRGDSS